MSGFIPDSEFEAARTERAVAVEADRSELLRQVAVLEARLAEQVRVDPLLKEMTIAMQQATMKLDALQLDRDLVANRALELLTERDALRRAVVHLSRELSAAQVQAAREPSRVHLLSALAWTMLNVRSCPEAMDAKGHPMGWVPNLTFAWEENLAAAQQVLADGLTEFKADNGAAAVPAEPRDLLINLEEAP